MIVQAEIRTGDGRVDDTLWVTDRSGHKITAEAQLRELRLSLILIEHFSSRLPRATNPEAALVHFSRFATDDDGPARLGRGVRGARPARGARRPGPGAGRERLPLGRLPPRPARRTSCRWSATRPSGARRDRGRAHGRAGRRPWPGRTTTDARAAGHPAVPRSRGLPRRLPRDPRPRVARRSSSPPSSPTSPRCCCRRPDRSPASDRPRLLAAARRRPPRSRRRSSPWASSAAASWGSPRTSS